MTKDILEFLFTAWAFLGGLGFIIIYFTIHGSPSWSKKQYLLAGIVSGPVILFFVIIGLIIYWSLFLYSKLWNKCK